MDAVTAAKDLQELGVNYTQEQLDQIKQAEEQRLRQRRMEREAKERERLAELYEDCDDRFAFIAGYTDGGAPFGVMWEEVGIDPGLPFEEKVNLYHMQIHRRQKGSGTGRSCKNEVQPADAASCAAHP